MLIFPAIELCDGRGVRLRQGDYDQMTVFSDDPAEIAEGFARAGATCLHAVDLDGARDGSPRNRAVIAALCRQPLFTEVGGGMRTERDIEQTLALGVDRVILGTVAAEDFDFTRRMAQRYGERVAVGVDAKDGFVATHGWRTVTDVSSLDFCRRLADAGVSTVIYTDISKDGLLAGTNLEVYRALAEISGLNIVASGGVAYEREIAALRGLNLYGVIVGKALYAGKLSLARILRIARGEAVEC